MCKHKMKSLSSLYIFQELDLPDEYSLELRVLIEEMMSQDPNTRPSANDIVKHDYLSYHRVNFML